MSISAYDIASTILDPDFSDSNWREIARPEQLPPEDLSRVWYVHGGRGSGKTRTGAETLAEWISFSEPGEWAVVAPTYGDARDVCVEGPSGLLKALDDRVRAYNRSMGEIRLNDGSVIWMDGADDGALRIQGKNLRGCWTDEVGLWRWRTKGRSGGKVAWEESIRFAVRISPAKIVATGTPKSGHPLVKQLMDDKSVVKTHMRTQDNIANLDRALVDDLIRQYGGTRLGQQELEGLLLEEVEGALWNLALIDQHRFIPTELYPLPEMRRVVVAVDPSWGTHGDECGIIVAGVGMDGRGFVLEDRSLRATPSQWGANVADAYRTWKADRILAEVNFQAEQVKLVMKTTDPSLTFKEVRVSRGKRLRAEPVVGLYEQGRVSHVGILGGLEQQMTEWVPEVSEFSPDRVDALVFAMDELLIQGARGPATVSTAARRRI